MTARRRLTLDACALLFFIILAVVGPLASRQTSEKMAAFATDAATTTGAVIYKKSQITLVSYAPTRWLKIAFKTDKGVDIQDWLPFAYPL